MNDDEIYLSKLYSFKNKSAISLGLKFKKEDFILPAAFPWINKALLFHTHAPKDLKTILKSRRTILEKADKLATPDNIKVSLDTQNIKK